MVTHGVRAVRLLGVVVPTGLLAIVVALLFAAPVTVAVGSASPALLRVAATPLTITGSTPPNPYANGMPATVALGQTSLDADGCPSSVQANTACQSTGVAVDLHGDVWVADRANNRVLEYVPPFRTNMSASLVLGQSSFTSSAGATNRSGFDQPSGVAFDPAGDLWVADSANDRVVEYVPPFHNGMNASLVIGEPNFNTSAFSTANASTLDFPELPVFSPSGDLFVSDYDSNRVVEFTPPFTDGEKGSVFLGQFNSTTTAPRLEPYGLEHPVGLAVSSSGNLWVTDTRHDRLLEFAPPFVTNESASLVLGQTNFTSDISGKNGAANLWFSGPSSNGMGGVAVDRRGDVWAADFDNNRLVEYVPPLSDDMNASVVLGQPAFGSSTSGTSATGESGPRGIAFDAQGDLFEAEYFNDRVLEYVPTHFTVQFLEGGLSNATNWSVTFDGTTLSSTTGTIAFSEPNGSYSWTVTAVGGYSENPASGVTLVNGTATPVVVVFTSSSGAFSWGWELLTSVAALLAVVSLALVVALLARGRRPRPRPPPAAVEVPASPPASGNPPPPSS
jgi:sugar lactone lactonase YvrE